MTRRLVTDELRQQIGRRFIELGGLKVQGKRDQVWPITMKLADEFGRTPQMIKLIIHEVRDKNLVPELELLTNPNRKRNNAMMPDPVQAQQEVAEARRHIDEMLHKIKEASRMMELATHEIHKRDARIVDLEIECERLRGMLARNKERIRRMEEGEL
jgi:hypothetical protein